jgi:hypothetical protein
VQPLTGVAIRSIKISVAICSLIPTSPKIGCGLMGEQLLLLVKEIHMAADKLDISDLMATILDVGLMPHSIPSASASAILPSISCNTSSKGASSCETPSSSSDAP